MSTNRPLAVVDLSWLQSSSIAEGIIHRTCRFIIPDVLICELVDRAAGDAKDAESAGQQFEKLRRLVRRYTDRVFVGRYWNDICGLERSIWSRIPENDLIHWSYTRQIRAGAHRLSATDWHDHLRSLKSSRLCREHERTKEVFLTFCRSVTASLRSNVLGEVNRLSQNPTARHGIIQQPTLVYDLTLKHESKYSPSVITPQWRDALSVFPDHFGVARMRRMLAWYSMQHSFSNPSDESFENNWDDLHYGFLASYTHTLFSRDNGLRRMVDHVFGGAVSVVA